MKSTIVYFVFFFAMLGCGSSYQVIQLEALHSPWVKSPLNLKFEARNAYPFAGGIINLSSGYYSLEISGDTVNFHLPFYGRAYMADMNDQRYNVEAGLLKDLKVKQNVSKKSTLLSFDVKKENETFSFELEFWEDGSAYLNLNFMHRSNMAYDGDLIAE